MSVPLLTVGLGELLHSGDPQAVLVTYGLGSCVAVTVYDSRTRAGAMAHIVLPVSPEGEGATAGGPAKYADRAIEALVQVMRGYGAPPSRLIVKIAGGARVLNFPGAGAQWGIGERNVAAVRELLHKFGLPLVAADVGGNYGRTMRFYLASGRVVISTAGRGEKEI